MTLIDVLIEPSSRLRSRQSERGKTAYALSLLVENRIDLYQRTAASVGLPSPDALDDSHGALASLASGILAYRAGHGDAVGMLQSVLESDEARRDERLLAAILISLAAADSGRPDFGLTVLESSLPLATTPSQRALIYLHAGVRQAQLGDAERAYRATRAAGSFVRRGRDRRSKLLAVVASRNSMSLSFLAFRRTRSASRHIAESETLAWIEGVWREALSKYLGDHFKAFFENPYVRTFSFASVDVTDQDLMQALFRADATAYYQGSRQLRQALGQYRMLSAAGQPGNASTIGFELLRRAGEADDLKRSTSVFLATGPLEPLRQVGQQVCQATWFPSDLRATLVLLRGCSSVLDDQSSAIAFDRVCGLLPQVLTKPIWNSWSAAEAIELIGALVPNLTGERVAAASRELLDIANLPPSPHVHQSMGPAIEALRGRIGPDGQRAWYDYVSENLGSQSDRLFPAIAAAAMLLGAGYRDIERVVSATYSKTLSPWLAGLMLRVPIGRSALAPLRDETVLSVRRVRAESAQGRYAFGGPSVGARLAQLAIRLRDREVRRELVDFLLDSHVAADERIAAAEVLVRDPTRVPRWIGRAVAGGLPVSDQQFPFFAGRADLQAMNLELALAFATVDEATLFAAVIEAATSDSSEQRITAARLTARQYDRLGDETAATILIGLCNDQLPVVRGMAGNALAAHPIREASLDRMREQILRHMLADGGQVVPELVWKGLLHAKSKGGLSLEFEELAAFTSRRHISRTVRSAARQVAAGHAAR